MQSQRINLSPPVAVLIGAVAMCIAVAASLLVVTRTRDGDVVIISDPTSFEVVVEVRGAVHAPGVYRLSQDARLGDLLTAAGGVSNDADLAQHNLARRLVDGEVVQIELVSAATPVSAGLDPGAPPQAIAYKININTADSAELESLPGIGPVIAQRIIEYRTANGPFTDVEQLTRVQGISENQVAEIQNLITIGP
jgi:competence protein ComEA